MCHYWLLFMDSTFNIMYANGNYDLTMIRVNISDIAIITVKNVDYRCIIHNISKSESVNLLKKIFFWKSLVYIKKFGLKFHSIQDRPFFTNLFSVYKTVDIMDVYNSSNIAIVTVIKHPEMLKFFPDHLKTKAMCKHAVKKLPYLLRYVYQLSVKAIIESLLLTATKITKCVVKLSRITPLH